MPVSFRKRTVDTEYISLQLKREILPGDTHLDFGGV